MNNKFLKIYLKDSTLKNAVKKRAAELGKSISETGKELIESALTGASTRESLPVTGIGPVSVAEPPKRNEWNVPPEVLRYLVQDLAKTENLLRQISRLLSPESFKAHEERVRIAEQKAERILKSLDLDGLEDVDRLEIRTSTPEETESILREIGIGQDHSASLPEE